MDEKRFVQKKEDWSEKVIKIKQQVKPMKSECLECAQTMAKRRKTGEEQRAGPGFRIRGRRKQRETE